MAAIANRKDAPAERVFVKDKAAVTRQVHDETIVVPVRTGAADLEAIYVLNETGSWIWQHLDGRANSALVAGLVAAFDISEAQAEKDLETFLTSLEGEGLVSLVGSKAAAAE
jgi:hypothetical protein